jgi:hypothetical protein
MGDREGPALSFRSFGEEGLAIRDMVVVSVARKGS